MNDETIRLNDETESANAETAAGVGVAETGLCLAAGLLFSNLIKTFRITRKAYCLAGREAPLGSPLQP